jgi:hypothetical protein
VVASPEEDLLEEEEDLLVEEPMSARKGRIKAGSTIAYMICRRVSIFF